MSLLPPTAAVTPKEVAPQKSTPVRNGADKSKDFAKALDNAVSSDRQVDKQDSPQPNKVDNKDRQDTKPGEKTTLDKPVDKTDVKKTSEKSGTKADETVADDESTETKPVTTAPVDNTTDEAKAAAAMVAAGIAASVDVAVVPIVATPVAVDVPVDVPVDATVVADDAAITAVTTAPVATAGNDTQAVATPQTPATASDDVTTGQTDLPVATDDAPAVAVATQADIAGNDELLAALAKNTELVDSKGNSTVEKTTGVGSAEQTARAVLDALAPTKQNDSPLATTATSGAESTDVPTPVRQLVNLVSPLRHQGDGDYKLLLQLHPEHLGRVEVAVSLNQGQISMQLNADSSASRQMLRDSMNDLRDSLNSAGLDTGALDVGNQSMRDGGKNTTESGQNGQVYDNATDVDEEQFFARLATTATNTQATDGPLDIHV